MPKENNINKVDVAGLHVGAFDSTRRIVEYIYDNYISRTMSQVGSNAIAVNPEKVISSMEDKDVKRRLKKATILYPDGIGVVKVMERKCKQPVSRIPGCELWEALMVEAGKQHASVFLLGARNEVVKAAALKLSTLYNVNVVGALDGYFEDRDLVIEEIKNSKPAIVAVAMGSPAQEAFIEECLSRGLKSFFMGVGGTFDVFTGKAKRAPQFYLNMNIEWLHRLLTNPSRLRLWRQTKLIKFFYLYLRNKL